MVLFLFSGQEPFILLYPHPCSPRTPYIHLGPSLDAQGGEKNGDYGSKGIGIASLLIVVTLSNATPSHSLTLPLRPTIIYFPLVATALLIQVDLRHRAHTNHGEPFGRMSGPLDALQNALAGPPRLPTFLHPLLLIPYAYRVVWRYIEDTLERFRTTERYVTFALSLPLQESMADRWDAEAELQTLWPARAGASRSNCDRSR